MLKAFMASAFILASSLTFSAPVTSQTQESVQATTYQVAQRRGSRAYVCTRDRNGYLNFRSGPSRRNRIKGRINNGGNLTILRSRGNWYQVRYRGRIGWVNADFVCRGNSRNKTRLTMYIAKDYQVFKTKTAYVSRTRPITDIVGKLLKEGIVAERVGLIGYKVTVRNRIATINLITNRLGLGTLTSTELFTLLGSLNKTLTENSQLDIDRVLIAENGELLYRVFKSKLTTR